MRLLLDTHSFLWFSGGDERLSREARAAIADVENDALLSVASLWEMAIKINIGKLKLPRPFGALIPEQLDVNEIEVLRSRWAHFATYIDLPLHHRDPFDRLMIAQAKAEDLRIVGKDRAFEQYDVRMLW